MNDERGAAVRRDLPGEGPSRAPNVDGPRIRLVPRADPVLPRPGGLGAARDSARRMLRALDILERMLWRGSARSAAEADPRLRAPPRGVAALVWLIGLPDRPDEGDPVTGRAVRAACAGTAEIAEWIACVGGRWVPPLLVEVPEDRQGRWIEPADRLLHFAHESAAEMVRDLGRDLGALPGATCSCAA